MFKQKIFGIVLVIILAGAGGVIFNTGCYDDSEARVTIHLERNDLAGNSLQKDKRIIDRVLEFFSKKAEASAGWDGTHGPLTLTVTSSNFETLIFSIPATAISYTVVIPIHNNVKFEIYSTTSANNVPKNWAGGAIADIVVGDNNINLTMLPMTKISSFLGSPGSIPTLTIYWESSSPMVTSYKIYRATSPEGSFVNIGSTAGTSFVDSTGTPNVLYYYRISTVSTLGESVLCDYSSYTFPLQV